MLQIQTLKRKRLFILLFIIFIFLLNVIMFSWAKPSTSKGKVCIFFDDGWQNQHDQALPILREFDLKGSFGIITGYIGVDRGTFWSRMNISELEELERNGMEIASHSRTHPHMLNLTNEKLHSEIVESKIALTQLGFTINTFVYPYGEWNSTVMKYVKDADYLCARTITCETYNLTSKDPDKKFQIGSWIITNQNLNEFKDILNHATEDEVVVLTYHFVSDEGPESLSTSLENYYLQMRYLKDNGYEVILLSDICKDRGIVMWKQFYLIIVALVSLGLATIMLFSSFHKKTPQEIN